jgi:hypothetical protein
MSGLPDIARAILPPAAAQEVLAVYNIRADKVATVNQSNLAFNRWATALANDLAAGTQSRTITLVLQATSTPAQAAIVRPTSPGSPGTPPRSVAQAPTTKPIAKVTFDVSLDGGVGFVQSITDRAEANQSTHQTAGGFYVDQFGMKPGEFSLQAIVALTGDVATHLQVFKDLLFKAKLLVNRNSRNVQPPPRLLYTNSIDGRTLLLTQASLEISQKAENPNMAMVELRGSILSDYATALAAPQDDSALTGIAAASVIPALALATDGSGDFFNTTTAVAGVAAQ